MRLKFLCLPELHGHIPEPVLAKSALPGWLKDIPSTVPSELLGNEQVRTLKHCPPIIDGFSTGILFKLPCDVVVKDGEFSWHWPKPVSPNAQQTRSPIGLHVPEQATGAPLGTHPDDFIIKFNNFWSVEAPEGVSLLFTHPLNREELPFRTLAGIVDCDRFKGGFVHFPALWRQPEFEGTLEAGTPIAQAFPFKRESLKLDCGAMDESDFKTHQNMQSELQAEPGHYRKTVRASRSTPA